MIQPFTKHLLLNSALFFLLLACASDTKQDPPINLVQTQHTSAIPKAKTDAIQVPQKQSVTQTTTPSSDKLLIFFDSNEAAAIQQIKQVFDEGLRGSSKDRTLTYLYKDHAQRMRLDYFNKYPLTLNYPFNGKFDLSLVQEDVPALSFFTNKCGFQKEGSDEIIHYYCLKDEGNFIDFMEHLGKENTLIDELCKNYISQKSISQNVKQLLVMNSSEFDFEQPAHQLVYMFYQILINEERLAADKI